MLASRKKVQLAVTGSPEQPKIWKRITWSWPRPVRRLSVHRTRLTLHVVCQCTKIYASSFNRSENILGGPKSKNASRDHDFAAFRDGLDWVLLWSICVPNLKSVTPAVTKIWMAMEYVTRSSAIADGPRDAKCQSNSFQVLYNIVDRPTTCTTSPEQIEVMELEGYSRPTYNKLVHSATTRSSVVGVIHKLTVDVDNTTCIWRPTPAGVDPGRISRTSLASET